MRLVETVGAGFTKWSWENDEGTLLSPFFATKERAQEWYGLHESWLEQPAILEPIKRDTNETK